MNSNQTIRLRSLLIGLFALTTLGGCYHGDTAPLKTAVQINQLQIDSLSLSTTNDTLEIDEQVTPTVTATLKDGSTLQINQYVSWFSSAPSVASITDNGLVTGLLDGQTMITARFGDLQAVLSLSVSSAALSAINVSIPSQPVRVCTYESVLTATGVYEDGRQSDISDKVSWSSNLENLATVKALTLLALQAGNVEITAQREGITSAPLTITIDNTLSEIIVAPSPANVEEGNTIQFTATGNYSDDSSADITEASTYAFANDDGSTPSFLTASEDTQGLFTATTAGTGILSVACAGLSASQSVTISEPLAIDHITIDGGNLITKKVDDEDFQLTAILTYNNNTTVDITDDAIWTVEDVLEGESITVRNNDDNKGEVSISAVGKSVIKVTYEGVSDTIQIDVEE